MKTEAQIEDMAIALLKHLAPNMYIGKGLIQFTLEDAKESIRFIQKGLSDRAHNTDTTSDLRMLIVNRDRGLGKTTEAVKQAHRTGAYIIVKDRPRAVECMQLAEELHLNIRFPITFGEFLDSRLKGSYINNIVIDDADELFLSLFRGLDIEMITMNIKDVR